VGGWLGEARRFGEGMAVLAGDLAFVYADQLLAPAVTGADRGGRVREVWDELRVEVTMGQHLDVLGAAQGHREVSRAALVAQIKSGRYSVERPLQLGAALAGRLDELGPVLTAYGRPLGAAFQYRDDLLGAVGDPRTTGKPVGDDLREGKPTLLVALAHRLADERQRAELAALGDPDLDERAVSRLQEVLVDCGAVDQLEQIIVTLVVDALGALDHPGLSAPGRDALAALAEQLAFRQR
jgi:geranylgeranyl diphosphate synthase type I